jgi:hypothetical protein
MSVEPIPLPVGSLLAERFEVLDVLGRGGFGIAYLGLDLLRGDKVAIKELAPAGVRRSPEGILDLDSDPERSGHLLRTRFQREAETIRKVRSSGVPRLRTTFTENGTAYSVADYAEGAESVANLIAREGRLEVEAARELLVSLFDILEKVHEAGVLHRDVKPSNVLTLPNGGVLLIDFGSAREYSDDTQTIMYTPGYAPPEQLSERAPRGPATDLYGLAATIWHVLAGSPPPTANDRIAGVDLPPLRSLRSDVPESLAQSLERALSIRMADRPQSVAEWRAELSEPSPPEPTLTLADLDESLARARALRFDRRGCPGCKGVLVEVRPLRRLTCPVCREGTIRTRDLDENLCPHCRDGRLVTYANVDPPAICPTCAEGRFLVKRKGLLGREQTASCSRCSATYERRDGRWERSDGIAMTDAEWRQRSGRAEEVRLCETCTAQFDRQPDGRWQMVLPQRERIPLYQDEWARVAAGLEPGAGNAVCDQCRADFWLEPNRMTLMDIVRDPFEFAAEYLGRSLLIEDARWLAVGKTSGRAGPVSDLCGTEFDLEGDELVLVRSPHRALALRAGERFRLGDWHRIGAGLPTPAEEPEVEARMDELLRIAYREGELPFESHSDHHWRGRARRRSDGHDAVLTITPTEVRFGGAIRKTTHPLGDLSPICGEGEVLTLGEESYEIEWLNLRAELRSGVREVTLGAEDIAYRILRRRHPEPAL